MKDSVRRIVIEKRNKLSKNFIDSAEKGIMRSFKNSELMKYDVFMAYFPIKKEAPIKNLIKSLKNEGKTVSLPVTDSDNKLIPVCFDNFNNLKRGKYQIPEPADKILIEPENIDVVLVPGVVFDLEGGRIGYGKGCYDRYLSGRNMIKVGVCYEFQISDKPMKLDSHDIRMDYILTEKSIYKIR